MLRMRADFLAGRRRGDRAPVLVDELADALVLVRRQAAELVEWHLARGDAAGVHRLQQGQCRRRPAGQQSPCSSRIEVGR